MPLYPLCPPASLPYVVHAKFRVLKLKTFKPKYAPFQLALTVRRPFQAKHAGRPILGDESELLLFSRCYRGSFGPDVDSFRRQFAARDHQLRAGRACL